MRTHRQEIDGRSFCEAKASARETYIPFNGHQMAIAVITKRLPVYAEKAL